MTDAILSSSGNKDDISVEAALSIFHVEVYDAQNMDVMFSQPFPAMRIWCFTYDYNASRRRGPPFFTFTKFQLGNMLRNRKHLLPRTISLTYSGNNADKGTKKLVHS